MSSENKDQKSKLRTFKSALLWALIIELFLYAVTLYTSIIQGFHSRAVENVDTCTHFFGHLALSLVRRLKLDLLVDPLIVTTIVYFVGQIIVFFVFSLVVIKVLDRINLKKGKVKEK